MKTPNNHTHYHAHGNHTIYYRHTGSQAFIWVDGLWKNMPMAEFEHLKPMITPVNPVSVESVYVPQVGEVCEFNHPQFGWTKCTIIGPYIDGLVCAPNGGGFYDAEVSNFRPLPDQAQQRREELLSKWRDRSLDYAHDTERTSVPLGVVFDFIVGMEGES